MSASRAPLSVGMSGLTSSFTGTHRLLEGASLNVRPMAMFSPTLFVGGEAGIGQRNFKGPTGVFTTT